MNRHMPIALAGIALIFTVIAFAGGDTAPAYTSPVWDQPVDEDLGIDPCALAPGHACLEAMPGEVPSEAPPRRTPPPDSPDVAPFLCKLGPECEPPGTDRTAPSEPDAATATSSNNAPEPAAPDIPPTGPAPSVVPTDAVPASPTFTG